MKSTGISGREMQAIREFERREMLIFSPEDVIRFLGVNRYNAFRILNSMVAKGLLVRLAKGKYILKEAYDSLDELAIASQLSSTSYVSLWSALNFHKMTEQAPTSIFVSATNRRRRLTIRGMPVCWVTIPTSSFFGYRSYGRVVASDPEKTIIDCILLPGHAGGLPHVFSGLGEDLDTKILVEYCERIASPALTSRLGFMMERKGLEFDRERMRRMVKGYTTLMPGKGRSNLNEFWKLYVNGDIE